MNQGKWNLEAVHGEIFRLEKLSCSPVIAAQLMKFLEKPNPSATDLVEWISLDQVLTARILKLANSRNYGFSRHISTLNLAIITIGLQPLKDLLKGITVIDQFSDMALISRKENRKIFSHSICVAEGARRLATLVDYPTSGEAYIAGLLHDIGRQILIQMYPENYSLTCRYAQNHNISIFEAEKQVLDCDHGQVGSWLARSWNFPDNLIDAIENHHQPQTGSHGKKLTYLVHLANLICHSMDHSNGDLAFQNNSDPEPEILEKLKKYFSVNGRSLRDFHNLFEIKNRKYSITSFSGINA